MADDDVHPHATTLEMGMDMTVDPDLEVLRVAAAKAQDAAIKYQTQTTSLCETRSFSPHSDAKNHGEVISRPIEMQHINQVAVAEGFEPAQEGDDNVEEGPRKDTLYTSSTIVPNRFSSPSDSALGESLSDTEELVRQPSVNLQHSVVDTPTPMVNTTSYTEPELIYQQSLGPLQPHTANTDSDGLIAGEKTVKVEPDRITSQAKGGCLRSPVQDERVAQNLTSVISPREPGPQHDSESTVIASPQVFMDLTLLAPKGSKGQYLHKQKAASQKPKRLYQPKPPCLPENAMSNAAIETSRRSPPKSTQSFRQSKNNGIQSRSNLSHPSLESSSQRVRPIFRSEDVPFVQVFQAVVYPNIKASADRYKKYISRDDLIRIGKSVSLPDTGCFQPCQYICEI